LFDHAEFLANQIASTETLSIPLSEQRRSVPIIATGHLTTVGVTTSESVRDIYIGTLEAFPANAFPAADYIALGHIHRAQAVAKTDHIRYSGSPIPLSFDEAKQDKSVFMVDFLPNETTAITPLIIPCFQPLLMIKATLDSLSVKLLQAVDSIKSNGQFKPDEQVIWLDIEIESADYLHDLQSRIKVLTQELPVEILLVRRSKKSRALMPSSQKKITLNELTLDEVFDSRLEQESWDSEEEKARKTRLASLFQQTLSQVKTFDTDTHKAETNETAEHQTEAKS
jgi:exonuclease SbcD